jgi:hypothetical protein
VHDYDPGFFATKHEPAIGRIALPTQCKPGNRIVGKAKPNGFGLCVLRHCSGN